MDDAKDRRKGLWGAKKKQRGYAFGKAMVTFVGQEGKGRGPGTNEQSLFRAPKREKKKKKKKKGEEENHTCIKYRPNEHESSRKGLDKENKSRVTYRWDPQQGKRGSEKEEWEAKEKVKITTPGPGFLIAIEKT